MIKVSQLCKSFRVHKKQPGLMGSAKALFKREWLEKQALRNVSLQINAGEIVGLIGANGAGKTTLVKTLAGIIHPSSGLVNVLGCRPWDRSLAFRQQISLIMGQKAQLWWDLPAADCFLLLREIYQIPKAEFQMASAFLIETLGVEKQLQIQIRRLSLGERMKMELIAALLHKPKVVFLDEPTIGLDLTAQRAIRKFILDYRSAHQPAMILTSHYMEDIEQLCHRIIIMRDGEIVFDGLLSEIMSKYATTKIVTITFRDKIPNITHYQAMGLLYSVDDTTIKLKVENTLVPEVASGILKDGHVIDLSIESEDISHIIESIIRQRPQHL